MKRQTGRSMIEMLAVLAIIGVVSIGGISLYRRAIDTHKANSIFDDVNRFEFVISERIDRTPRGFFDKADFVPTCGFEMNGFNEPELDSHYISVHDVPRGVCRIVLDKGEGKYVMFANNLIYEGDSSICRGDVLNEMRFYFGDTSDLCSFPAPGENSCSDGCLCPKGNECVKDIVLSKDNEDYTVCCPKSKNRVIACREQCMEDNCPNDQYINRETCQCDCADPMKQMDENGNCVCKSSSSNVPLVEGEDGEGKCSDASSTWLPSMNKCTKFSCTGEGGICKLDDKLCGVSCHNVDDYSRVSCNELCRPDLCPANYPFEKTPKGWSGGYWWACRVTDKKSPDANTECYKTAYSYYCFNNSAAFDRQCCVANADLQCTRGLCDQNYCTETFGSGVSYGRVNDYGGCFFNNVNIQCYPTDLDKTYWTCFREGSNTSCATDCTTPPNCGNCTDACSGLGQEDSNGYCCVTHTGTEKEICKTKTDNYYYFKSGNIYDKCGVSCTYDGLTKQNDGSYTATSISCNSGDCQPTTCTDTTWSYGKVGGGDNVWGCVKGDIGCYKNMGGAYSPHQCWKGSNVCGRMCQSIDNSNCPEWAMKSCAPMVTKNNVTKPACIFGRVQGTENKNEYDYDCWCQSGNVDTATNICCPAGQIVRGNACVYE